MIRVAIIEDDPKWLSLMAEYLRYEKDMEVVATAASREGADALVDSKVGIDVVLMDVNLSGNKCDGITAALHFCANTSAKVVMLTAFSDKEFITNSFTAGACNYISKDHYKEIPAAIRTAHNDTTPMEVLLEDYRMMRELSLVQELTPSEKEVLTLAGKGHTRSAIQKELYKSENTIKSQIKSILKKMKVGSLQDAVRRIRNRGVE